MSVAIVKAMFVTMKEPRKGTFEMSAPVAVFIRSASLNSSMSAATATFVPVLATSNTKYTSVLPVRADIKMKVP